MKSWMPVWNSMILRQRRPTILDSSPNLARFWQCQKKQNYLCGSINFQMRNLWRIRQFIDQDWFLSSCSSGTHFSLRLLQFGLFTTLSAKELTRLQGLQNNPARLTFILFYFLLLTKNRWGQSPWYIALASSLSKITFWDPSVCFQIHATHDSK